MRVTQSYRTWVITSQNRRSPPPFHFRHPALRSGLPMTTINFRLLRGRATKVGRPSRASGRWRRWRHLSTTGRNEPITRSRPNFGIRRNFGRGARPKRRRGSRRRRNWERGRQLSSLPATCLPRCLIHGATERTPPTASQLTSPIELYRPTLDIGLHFFSVTPLLLKISINNFTRSLVGNTRANYSF